MKNIDTPKNIKSFAPEHRTLAVMFCMNNIHNLKVDRNFSPESPVIEPKNWFENKGIPMVR